MPGRNIYKDYLPDSYYHVYNRGVNKEPIFLDDQDCKVFLSLLKRYLSKTDRERRGNGQFYPMLHDEIELLAFCLMGNHFHLFVYQHDVKAMQKLMQSVTTAYSMYFNKRYDRVGPVFQQRYRASRITNDGYLLHITRYIHLNPDDYRSWEWSSLPYYTGRMHADWVRPARILELFNGNYLAFVDEYKNRRDALEASKHELELVTI